MEIKKGSELFFMMLGGDIKWFSNVFHTCLRYKVEIRVEMKQINSEPFVHKWVWSNIAQKIEIYNYSVVFDHAHERDAP